MNPYIILLTLVITSFSGSAQESCPCCTEAHRAFDFWIGEWTVYTPDGKVAGTNTISQQEDGCVLRENWISATPGYTGTSYNYFNSSEKTWTQIWIDNQGSSLHLTGRLTEGKMILSSAADDDDNGPAHRITWTPNSDGTVRQLWESRNAEGEWAVAFDGIYRRQD